MSNLRSTVPSIRVRALNDRRPRRDGKYVLYWMTAYRRVESNYALQRSAEWARHLGIPLVVLSALRLDYRWASDRTHAFILDSIADVDLSLHGSGALHFVFIEEEVGGGRGLLRALAAEAAVVVADDAPIFFFPSMVRTAAERVDVLMEGVDHNGIMPLRATDRVFLRAHDLRRFLQRELPAYLEDRPAATWRVDLPQAPQGLLADVEARWMSPQPDRSLVDRLPLDHSVAATPLIGGEWAAADTLDRFAADRLARYEHRNHPDEQVSSGLSPYLHFGHISPHQVLDAVITAEDWNLDRLADAATGSRQGWWGMSAAAEGFLDQVITWRELGYQAAARVPNNDSYGALPEWARRTLAEHAADPREYIYELDQFDSAETHDELWNAAQLQLRHEGIIHNYLRMLWGKKILEWSRSPQDAHDIMFELNNRYALDGRDPNSVSGIHWVLGRFDRPWGPERPIFGKVRYMSSDATRRKVRLKGYLAREQSLFGDTD
jgi:deoxyribodipyrimidine photo-lyase